MKDIYLREFLTKLRSMLFDPDFEDLADWESVPEPFKTDFKGWANRLPNATPWMNFSMPWSMYRLRYINELLSEVISSLPDERAPHIPVKPVPPEEPKEEEADGPKA